MIWLRRLILRNLLPLVKWMGKLRLPFTKKKIRADTVEMMINTLKKGDVILGTNHGEISNLFISGTYKHAAIWLGGECRNSVIESVSPIVRDTSIYQFCMTKDRLAICRSKTFDDKECAEAAEISKKQVGAVYDFDFHIPPGLSDKRNNKFYCAELVWFCYDRIDPKRNFKLRDVLGVRTVLPDDFLKATKYWDVVWESK